MDKPLTDIKDLHVKFGYAGKKVIRAAMCHLGIRVKGIMKSCDACQMAKACSKAIQEEAAKKSEIQGEREFTDLTRPITTFLGRSRYWLQIVYNVTRIGFYYFRKCKDMIEERVKKYINMVQAFNHQVKFICYINAGENKN